MNMPSSNPIEGGPLTDEELLKKYPALKDELGKTFFEGGEAMVVEVSTEMTEEVLERKFRHVPVYHYLVLMQVHDNWVVVYQSNDKQDRDEAMLATDDECDGVYELRAVDLDTQVIVPNIKEE